MESYGMKAVESSGRPRRRRQDVARDLFGAKTSDKLYQVDDVVSILKRYDDCEGGINCPSCGKLYKSKVCFTKHLWEHSVYWEMFRGQKNHERVLGIQAAAILMVLYNGSHDNQHGDHGDGQSDPFSDLASVLVTSPHKKDKDGGSGGNDGGPLPSSHTDTGAAQSQVTPTKIQIQRTPIKSHIANHPPVTPLKKSRSSNPTSRKQLKASVRKSVLADTEKPPATATTPVKRSKVTPPLTPVKHSRLDSNCTNPSREFPRQPKNPAKRRAVKKIPARGQLLTTESENVAPAPFSVSASASDMVSPSKFTRQC